MSSIDQSFEHHEPIAISIIVPAYNERLRLPAFLTTVRQYSDTAFGDEYEVIVVDDGSEDGTTELLEIESARWPQLVMLRHMENLGKGAAVRTGMLCARGVLCLFADADGATPIAEAAQLRRAISAGAEVAIGSRLAGATVDRQRTMWRSFAGRLFSCLTRTILPLRVADTQCGFKLFRRDVARRLFADLQERGFAFDLELLAMARLHGYRVTEIPVAWREVPGSKLRVIRDSWRMFRSLIAIRRRVRREAVAREVQVLPSPAVLPQEAAVR